MRNPFEMFYIVVSYKFANGIISDIWYDQCNRDV